MSARINPIPIRSGRRNARRPGVDDAPVQRYQQPTSEGRPKAMNLLSTYAHHTALAKAFFTFNGHIIMATTLTERQRELIVLRVGTKRKAPYEFTQHLLMANDAGISDEEIRRVENEPDSPLWSDLDRAVLRAVDDLIDDGGISDTTWAALAAEFNEQQLLDLIYTVGAYESVAFMLRSCGIQLDDGLADLLAAFRAGAAG
jgi:alkylhydroperoxidase family enzyme